MHTLVCVCVCVKCKVLLTCSRTDKLIPHFLSLKNYFLISLLCWIKWLPRAPRYKTEELTLKTEVLGLALGCSATPAFHSGSAVQVFAALLLTQLTVCVPDKAENDKPEDLGPRFRVGDKGGVPSAWLPPGPGSAMAVTQGVDKQT